MLLYFLINRPCELKLVLGDHFFEVARTKPEFIDEWESYCQECGANFSYCTAGCCGWIKNSIDCRRLIKLVTDMRKPQLLWEIFNFYKQEINPELFWDIVLPYTTSDNVLSVLADFWQLAKEKNLLPLEWHALAQAFQTATVLNEEIIVFR